MWNDEVSGGWHIVTNYKNCYSEPMGKQESNLKHACKKKINLD